MHTTVIYPGTFDPFTYGHVDLVERALSLFDHVVIGIAASASKSPLLTLEQRLDITQRIFADNPHVSVAVFHGLIVDFMRTRHIRILIRGIRTATDTTHELQLADMNRHMYPEMETLLLTANPRFAAISSTIVREIAKMGGDLTPFVPPVVQAAFTRSLS